MHVNNTKFNYFLNFSVILEKLWVWKILELFMDLIITFDTLSRNLRNHRWILFCQNLFCSNFIIIAWDERDLEIRPKSSLGISSRNRDFEAKSTGNRTVSSVDTVRSAHSVKSVTIAPKVTEFHYSGDLKIWFFHFNSRLCKCGPCYEALKITFILLYFIKHLRKRR